MSAFRFPLKFARGCRLVRGNSTHAPWPTYTSIKSTSVSIRLACVSMQLNFRLAILKRQWSKYSVPFDFKRLYLPVPPHSFDFVEYFLVVSKAQARWLGGIQNMCRHWPTFKTTLLPCHLSAKNISFYLFSFSFWTTSVRLPLFAQKLRTNTWKVEAFYRLFLFTWKS